MDGAKAQAEAAQQPERLMLSCDNCRKKKIRCNGSKPACASCQKSGTRCNYSPVGPRKKPRRPTQSPPKEDAGRRAKRRASLQHSDTMSEPGVGSVSCMMLERLRESDTPDVAPGEHGRLPVMEMLRLQTQISGLVDQLRSLTVRASGVAPDAPEAQQPPDEVKQPGSSGTSSPEHPAKALNVSRDLINDLVAIYFQFCHPAETGMYPVELYRDRLQRAQVSEPFLLSVLAVASRFSDDTRVRREPVYLSGYDFFERVTRSLMMDVLERDSIENMLTLNNLAVYAVGLPVANRGWYFSGLAMRMATQMSLQKLDAPGRMPGASMMSGPGIESARRAFWTTLLLEALASFASGEPPPITVQDIHVAEPIDDPLVLNTNRANISMHIAQLAMLLVRVARINGNRHPESAQFSPEYAALHADMVAWYHGLPDSMQIKQQCLTAACTMTELLTTARPLDVRYHIVTFGFAVFMAGVVHVGAVAHTQRGSAERQYSINCVKEHIRCLDQLGRYFAFHCIMAKHIRAQLQALEARPFDFAGPAINIDMMLGALQPKAAPMDDFLGCLRSPSRTRRDWRGWRASGSARR
ncbi:hypothetical protein BX070DRAFT_2554 [Coemansia spiralis]|nr:hypothetical protein BX070DRAFT_2554 [Coemansia spiralis]